VNGTISNENAWIDLIYSARKGEKFPLAKLISLVEQKNSFEIRKKLFKTLDSIPPISNVTIGITGSPGAGKSSLLGELSKDFLINTSSIKMAIIAIDPSSNKSGGSILGDRTRLSIPAREDRIFFRSQASQLDLGGVNPSTYHVLRLLRYFFEYIFIETVGIGQNEIEISYISDYSYLVMQPLAGDQIQYMKSGIMEIPNGFIINKCDEKELANQSYHTLLSSLEFLKEILQGDEKIPPVFLTSVPKHKGTSELLRYFLELPISKKRHLEILSQIKKWVLTEFGKIGWNFVQGKLNFSNHSNYEAIEEQVINLLYPIWNIEYQTK
jgi:LAO/AO transport system kinase